jgi:hypothetical protein
MGRVTRSGAVAALGASITDASPGVIDLRKILVDHELKREYPSIGGGNEFGSRRVQPRTACQARDASN